MGLRVGDHVYDRVDSVRGIVWRVYRTTVDVYWFDGECCEMPIRAFYGRDFCIDE